MSKPEATCEPVEPGQLTNGELIALLQLYPADQPVFLEVELGQVERDPTLKLKSTGPATGVRVQT